MPYNYQILTNFLIFFTVRIRRKFAILSSLKIPAHLKCWSSALPALMRHPAAMWTH